MIQLVIAVLLLQMPDVSVTCQAPDGSICGLAWTTENNGKAIA